jgi:hypothetical protein
MNRVFFRHTQYLFLLVAVLGCSGDEKRESAPLTETESNLVVRSCLDFAKFLCLDLTGTNHVETTGFFSRLLGGPTFQVARVSFGDYVFDVDRQGAIRWFWVKTREPSEQRSSSVTLPSPEQIRQFLCPNVKLSKPTMRPLMSGTAVLSYTWRREESGFVDGGQQLYWEWVNVQLDEKTHRCLYVLNTVNKR